MTNVIKAKEDGSMIGGVEEVIPERGMYRSLSSGAVSRSSMRGEVMLSGGLVAGWVVEGCSDEAPVLSESRSEPLK